MTRTAAGSAVIDRSWSCGGTIDRIVSVGQHLINAEIDNCEIFFIRGEFDIMDMCLVLTGQVRAAAFVLNAGCHRFDYAVFEGENGVIPCHIVGTIEEFFFAIHRKEAGGIAAGGECGEEFQRTVVLNIE